MAPLLIQLQSNQDKYRNLLDGMMMEKVSDDGGLQELQAITSVRGLQDASYVAEQLSGKSCLLALHPIDEANVEEAVLQLPPPVRQVNIPHTLNRLIDLKYCAQGANHTSGPQQPYFRAGGHLRDWTPGRDGQDLILMFGNRYLTSSHDTGDNVSIEMSPIVDPLNILCPLIKNEVHTADNVVEYWERRGDYNLSTIHVLASGQLSPLKKIKRKVSYRMSSSDESGNDNNQSAPNKQLRHLILGEVEGAVGRTDMSMKEVA
ncbi:hypothetical protein V8D89_014344 [Ganoderma adspersum]